jgi:hypothetical protein
VKLRALLSLTAIVVAGALGAGVAGASTSGTEYFTAVSTSENGPVTVVASGPISAVGTDTVLGTHRDKFVFPAGTLTVRHEFITRAQKFDVSTCTFTFKETGTYVITRGTGAYAHVTGSGRYRASAVGTGCDPNEPLTSFIQIIQAHGPITL